MKAAGLKEQDRSKKKGANVRANQRGEEQSFGGEIALRRMSLGVRVQPEIR
jgi:hypothetical protein